MFKNGKKVYPIMSSEFMKFSLDSLYKIKVL